jgi:CheY-like chemotaxis protein
MVKPGKQHTILMVDDDAEDCLLVRDALQEVGLPHDLRFVRDGEEMFDYLYRREEFVDQQQAPPPDLILLDLKMPRMNGHEVLRALKTHGLFRRIPVVALTTSTAEDDVDAAYDLGVNSYITKPVTFHAWVDIMRLLIRYWFEVAVLPPRE